MERQRLKAQIFGASGCALLILAAFLPTATTSLGMPMTLFKNGGWLGISLFAVAALSLVLAVMEKYLILIATTLVAIAACCRVFFAIAHREDFQAGWGLGVLCLGTVAVSTTVILSWSRLRMKRPLVVLSGIGLLAWFALNSDAVGQIRIYETVTLREALHVVWGSI